MEYIENKPNILLFAIDETGMNLESNNFYSWSPVGMPTEVIKNGIRGGLSFIGATEVSKEFTTECISIDKIDSDVVIAFLEHMKKLYPNKILIFLLDNARIHDSKKIKKYLSQKGNRIILIYLPKYSPKINPQENIWSQLKAFCNQAKDYKNKNELLDSVGKFYKWVSCCRDIVKRWCYWKLYFVI